MREGEQTRRTTYVGNSQQMLRDIKKSLQHLKRQPEQPQRLSQQAAATPSSNAATTVVHEQTTQANATRIVHNPNRRGMSHAKALAEIRSSLKPFEATESGYSSCSENGEAFNKQYLMGQLKAMGLDEDMATEAIKMTANRTVEDALQLIETLASTRGYNRVNFGSNTPSSRSQLPPPYNAAVSRPWKGSEEETARAESPMIAVERVHSTVSMPCAQASTGMSTPEATRAEWCVQRSNNPGQLVQNWRGARVAAPQQRFVERAGPKMQLGWKPTSVVGARPMQGMNQGQPQFVNGVGANVPSPQFHVTANLTLTGNNTAPDEYQGRMASTVPNVTGNGANNMSFNIYVQTNFAQNSSENVQSSTQGQFYQTTPQHIAPTVVQGAHSDALNSNSPIPSTQQTPVPHFVQSFDPTLHPPPAYAPVARRQMPSDVSMGESSNWQNHVPRVSSRSPVPPPCDQWRHSWNTETSSNSGSISDEMPWSSSYNDSGPPSPLSDSSFTVEGPTKVTNVTGTVVYRLDSPKRPPIPNMETSVPCNEDDDQMSESDMETLTPGQRYRQYKEKSKLKTVSPTATKFYLEQHFENLMKNTKEREKRRVQLEEEMDKVGLSHDARDQMRKILMKKETNYTRLKRSKMDITMYDKISKIGTGAFGEVWLVRKIDTNVLYAMKILRKTEVYKRNQMAHVKAERDILAEADNEWVVKLYYSFQDEKFLYLVMDYIPGGDLMSLLIKFEIFPEDLARFYIAELVLAIESVHNMGFVHRDIKPDNVLIDHDGHIKLTDFGLCTGFRWTHDSKYYEEKDGHKRQESMEYGMQYWDQMEYSPDLNEQLLQKSLQQMKPLERRHFRKHKRSLAHSLVGTPNYIAPEVLQRSGYTHLCDWWSVGVIMYEMLVGQPPFLASTPADTQLKVINWETTLHIPKQAELSPQAKDLILRLCTSPEKRLGKNGIEEIKNHPFFAHVDWSYGVRRMQAPYRPRIASPTDTSNFDPVEESERMSSDEGGAASVANETVAPRQGKHPEHAFYEFTFRRFFDDGGNTYTAARRYSSDDSGTDTSKEPVYV